MTGWAGASTHGVMEERGPCDNVTCSNGKIYDCIHCGYWCCKNGTWGIAPTHVRRLPRPSAALYRGFPASAWTFMTIGSDVTVKNTPV